MNSEVLLQNTLPTIQNNEISIYTGPQTTKCIIENMIKIKQAFPTLPIGFYKILEEMIKDEKIPDSRFNDAVKHVIKTCIYPTPTIANFISFDKRIKLYTHKEMVNMANDYGPKIWDQYKATKTCGTIKWVDLADYESIKHLEEKK